MQGPVGIGAGERVQHLRDAAEAFGQGVGQLLAFGCQGQRAPRPVEQGEAQVGLQVAHLLGDGGVAYVQERARPGDRPGFRIGGKGAQGGQRGQAVPVFHVSSTYTLSGFLTRMRAP